MGHCKGGPHMSYSPNKMGHESPAKNQNKGYAKQERKDLMQDMPIVKDAMGGRSWMSKHSKSALRMGHSPAEMGHDSPAKKYGAMKGDQSASRSDYKNYKGTDKGYKGKDGSSHGDQSASRADYTSAAAMSPYKMGHDSPAKKEGEKPKNTEQLAAESRARGKKAAMKAKAKKDKKSGAHTGRMVKVMTSKGIMEVDSRSQAARDLPRA